MDRVNDKKWDKPVKDSNGNEISLTGIRVKNCKQFIFDEDKNAFVEVESVEEECQENN